jgi:hypothetical protein
VKIIYFGPKMSFFLHFSKKQKIDHFWPTKKAIFMCQPSTCSNYQVCGQISSKTFNLQGWNLQHCPQSAQSLGKNIKNNIYSINIYINFDWTKKIDLFNGKNGSFYTNCNNNFIDVWILRLFTIKISIWT